MHISPLISPVFAAQSLKYFLSIAKHARIA
jgi:hypothetical protein